MTQIVSEVRRSFLANLNSLEVIRKKNFFIYESFALLNSLENFVFNKTQRRLGCYDEKNNTWRNQTADNQRRPTFCQVLTCGQHMAVKTFNSRRFHTLTSSVFNLLLLFLWFKPLKRFHLLFFYDWKKKQFGFTLFGYLTKFT